jgi:hypothetical protein
MVSSANKANTLRVTVPSTTLKDKTAYTVRLTAWLVGNSHVKSEAVVTFAVS